MLRDGFQRVTQRANRPGHALSTVAPRPSRPWNRWPLGDMVRCLLGRCRHPFRGSEADLHVERVAGVLGIPLEHFRGTARWAAWRISRRRVADMKARKNKARNR